MSPIGKKKKKSGVGGASVGSAMAGLESAIMRTLPPPIEVAQHHRHDGPLVTADGVTLIVTLPDERR